MASVDTINVEADFSENEIFYSRTDKRGVIQSANNVFFRISGYSPDQLIGAPHKIVRHPEMPKAVFHLMWERLKQDLPVAAYVRNRAEDGRYYRVFAVIRPIRDGYLSVRVKPRSTHAAHAEAVYAELLAAEAQGSTPQDSVAKMHEALAAQGYDGYDAFMSEAMREEMIIRHTNQRGAHQEFLRGLPQMRKTLHSVEEEQSRLLEVFGLLHRLPTNMRIMASRLESSGGPVSAVSESYRLAVADILDSLRAVGGAGDAEKETLDQMLRHAGFDAGNYQMQRECLDAFTKERESVPGIDKDQESKILEDLTHECEQQARTHLLRISSAARGLGANCGKLRNKMIGLDQIRIMGDIESGRLRDQTELSVLMSQLGDSHEGIRDRLLRLISMSNDLLGQTTRNAF